MNKISLLQHLAQSSAKMSAKPAGSAKEACDSGKKQLQLQWSANTAFCGDELQILGKATGFNQNRQAVLQLREQDRLLEQLETEGEQQFLFNWQVHDLPFTETHESPYKVQAWCAAGGLKTQASDALNVIPVPDSEPQKIDLKSGSGAYAWACAPGVSIQKREVHVRLALRPVPALQAQWILFDAKADGRSDWAWVHKFGNRFVYWNTQQNPHAWADLPRPVAHYTIYEKILVEKDGRFVCRDDDQWIWPQPCVRSGLEQRAMQQWSQAVTAVWDRRFRLKRRNCRSQHSDCCSWLLRVHLDFSQDEADPPVYLVDGPADRFSLQDWYIRSDNPRLAAHQFGHWLGAYDEHEAGVLHPVNKNLDEKSIMGVQLGKPQAHHLHALTAAITAYINRHAARMWEFDLEPL